MEERVGFEPTVPLSRNNGFQDRRIRPLCHLSKPTISIEINDTKIRNKFNFLLEAKIGAPERSRTSNRQIRSLILYPIELRARIFHVSGGERGIRTLVPHFWSACLAGKCFRPLSHLSILCQINSRIKLFLFFLKL
jgi:hypothetical protein